jgi:hypothetical protein
VVRAPVVAGAPEATAVGSAAAALDDSLAIVRT